MGAGIAPSGAARGLAFVGAALLVMGCMLGLWGLGVGAAVVGGLVDAALLVIVGAWLLRETRRRHTASVLGHVEQAVRLGLPLPDMLRAAQLSETCAVRKRLLRVQDDLDDGLGLADALAEALPDMAQRDAALIACGERTGSLRETLARLVGERREAYRRSRGAGSSVPYKWYVVISLIGAVTVLLFSVVFVMPRFEALFMDFRISLPPITVKVLWATRAYPIVVPIVALAAFMVGGREVLTFLSPRLLTTMSGWRWLDWVLWWVPGVGAMARNRGLADVCHVLASSVAAGVPMDRALAEAAIVPVNRVLQGRVRRWSEAVQDGMPVAQAARDAWMPELVAGFLSAAETAGNTGQALEFLARYYDARFSRIAALLEGAAVPGTALVLAVAVGGMALAIFMPLIRLIDVISPWQGRI
jgi:type IV pilus assembly protein PilC